MLIILTITTRLMRERLHDHYKSRMVNPSAFSHQQPFLAALMDQESLSRSDLLVLLVEVFQGGIDATATTLAFCVYYLSRNADVQAALYEEVKDVDPAKHDLQGLRYLRAVLQETFRLRPSASANSRILHQDAVFSGYRVPAGTLVSSPPVVACHDERFFPASGQFKPERWLSRLNKEETTSSPASKAKIHPYALVPFGHGARMCPGRRLAEQEIFILLILLTKSFKIKEIDPGKRAAAVGQVMRLNMMPDAPIGVKLVPR
ncbi:cytochrome P450 302a1, mitochondrial-like [Palaemon carinicauda]|uniref:cytochrome P450 302a1, mitochondrial-like n=1 Tax=Palaemon carinicauda TaxID=392227 RepID=UPI0035B59AA7